MLLNVLDVVEQWLVILLLGSTYERLRAVFTHYAETSWYSTKIQMNITWP